MELSLSVKARVENTIDLFWTGLDCVDNVTHAAYGIIATAGSMITFGQIQRLNYHSWEYTIPIQCALPNLYMKLLKVINPSAQMGKKKLPDSVCAQLTVPVSHYAYNKAREESFIARHVISRACYIGLALTSVITRVMDLAVGILAAAASIGTLGLSKTINNFAIRQLQFFGIVKDVCYSLARCINPHATPEKP